MNKKKSTCILRERSRKYIKISIFRLSQKFQSCQIFLCLLLLCEVHVLYLLFPIVLNCTKNNFNSLKRKKIKSDTKTNRNLINSFQSTETSHNQTILLLKATISYKILPFHIKKSRAHLQSIISSKSSTSNS